MKKKKREIVKPIDNLLEWEIQWVKDHPHLYEGPMHQKAVIGNITKRYYIANGLKVVQKWHNTRWVKHEGAVFEYFGFDPYIQ